MLAAVLQGNQSVQWVDASSNSMGTAGAKAFGEMLQINTTLTQLNVSGNSFGKVQVGDSVKLRSGEVCTVRYAYSYGDIAVTKPDGSNQYDVKPSEFEWECSVPAFAAGIAASQSLLNVSAQHLCCCCLKRLTSVPNVCFSLGSRAPKNTQVNVSDNALDSAAKEAVQQSARPGVEVRL